MIVPWACKPAERARHVQAFLETLLGPAALRACEPASRVAGLAGLAGLAGSPVTSLMNLMTFLQQLVRWQLSACLAWQ